MKNFWKKIYKYLNTLWGKIIILMMFPISYILFYYVITNEYTLYIATTVPVSEVELRIDSSNCIFIPGAGIVTEEELQNIKKDNNNNFNYYTNEEFAPFPFYRCSIPVPKIATILFVDSNLQRHELRTELNLPEFFSGTIIFVIIEKNEEFYLQHFTSWNPELKFMNYKDIEKFIAEIKKNPDCIM